jgi:hypothetical protein
MTLSTMTSMSHWTSGFKNIAAQIAIEDRLVAGGVELSFNLPCMYLAILIFFVLISLTNLSSSEAGAHALASDVRANRPQSRKSQGFFLSVRPSLIMCKLKLI